VDVPQFFESLKPTHQEQEASVPGLTATLYPYQQRAVSWMARVFYAFFLSIDFLLLTVRKCENTGKRKS
jgi:SNF2 family DNA or RNA helicase